MESIETILARGLKMGDRQVRRAAYHNLQVGEYMRKRLWVCGMHMLTVHTCAWISFYGDMSDLIGLFHNAAAFLYFIL